MLCRQHPSAGSYKFSANLELPSNVVIRGQPTKGSATSGTKPGDLKPETVFECAERQHQGIFNNDPDAKNLGIIGVELDVSSWRREHARTAGSPRRLPTRVCLRL